MRTITLSQGLLAAVSLYALVSCDSKDAVQKELMEKGVISSVLDVGSPVGRNALCQAIGQDNMEITEKLLEAGVSPDAEARGENSFTPVLIIAVKKNNEELARMLLRHGANANAQNTDGDTALMYAAFAGQYDMVELLLDNKADANIKNGSQWTALMAACAKSGRISNWPGHPACRFAILPSPQCDPKAQRTIVQALLDAGAKSTCDKHGWTPAAIAACEGRPQMVKLLESLPTEYDDASVQPIPPLMAAAWAGETKTVEKLIKSGASVNGGAHHDTPLSCAARQGHAGIITALCQAGADPNLCEGGETPLACAARAHHAECVECLLKLGANAQDENAIGAAVRNGDTTSLQAIISAGADLKKLSRSKTLAEEIISALRINRKRPSHPDAPTPSKDDLLKICDMLIDGGLQINDTPDDVHNFLLSRVLNPYMNFDTDLSIRLVGKLLKAGIDINHADKEGETILSHYICFHPKEEDSQSHDAAAVIGFLLKSGANPNIENKDGDTPLLLALDSTWVSAKERPKILQALIDADVDVNRQNRDGKTALGKLVYMACLNSSKGQDALNCIEILTAAGADPNVGQDEEEPLISHLLSAITMDADIRYKMVETLLHGGADINARDTLKRTPLHTLIEESLHIEKEDLAKMAKLLMSARPDLTIKDFRGKTVLDELNNPYAGKDEKKDCLKRIIK